MKPQETRADYRCYNNVVGLIFLHAIARKYNVYASNSGDALERDEEEYVKLLYAKQGNSIVSDIQS